MMRPLMKTTMIARVTVKKNLVKIGQIWNVKPLKKIVNVNETSIVNRQVNIRQVSTRVVNMAAASTTAAVVNTAVVQVVIIRTRIKVNTTIVSAVGMMTEIIITIRVRSPGSKTNKYIFFVCRQIKYVSLFLLNTFLQSNY